MKIRAERDDLADVLSRAARAVGNRSPQQILQGLKCDVDGGRLKVTGTDGEVTIRTDLEVEVLDTGSTVVPAKLVAEAVRKLPAGAVTVSSRGGEVEITGNGPRFKFREFVVGDFPDVTQVDDGPGIVVDGDVLMSALAQVGVAASSDGARATLTGILFESDDKGARVVATDSYRLAMRYLEGVSTGLSCLIPFRALREMGRTVGHSSLSVHSGEREATFSSVRGQLTARVIDGTFPNYRQLFPESYGNKLIVSKTDLSNALARAALVAEDHIPVRLSVQEGGVELSVLRQEVGEEREFIPGTYTGENMTIAFNTRYLTDGVEAIAGDEAVLEIIDPLKPGMLSGTEKDGFQYLVMPVRL